MRRLVPLALAILLAGCQTENQTVIRIANWGGAGDGGDFDRLVSEINAKFEHDHPGVRVQIEGIPGEYVQKMLLNHVAGTMPDIMVLDAANCAAFLNNGVVQDLSPYIQKEPKGFMDQYWPTSLSPFSRTQKIYGIPNDFTPMVLYYNKDLFDAAGVGYPTDKWTFQDFRTAAKKLTNPRKKVYGFGFNNWMPGWIMWFWNNGGDVIDPVIPRATGTLDSPQNIQTLSFLRDLIKVDGSAPTLSEIASLGSDPFAEGKVAMTVSGHWSLVGYKAATKDGKPFNWERVGVAPLPSNLPERHTVLYLSAYAIPTAAKHPDLAWEYIKMWTSYQIQKRYNASGIAVCARKDVTEQTAALDTPSGKQETQFLPIIPSGRPPHGAAVEGYEMVEKVGKSMMDNVLINNVPPEVALKNAANRIDREFAKR